MFRKLLVLALVLSATSAFASADDPTDQEVLALVGPKTCQDGGFTDQMDRRLSIPIVTLDTGTYYEYCFRLPKLQKADFGVKTSGFVTLSLTNLANLSCGSATTYLIRPNRKTIFGKNVPARRTYAAVAAIEPGGILAYTPGTWRVVVHYETGCNKYRIDVTW